MENSKICVLSSGLPRFQESCIEIFKKQIGVYSKSVDFYGLFWEPVSDYELKEKYLQGFNKIKIWTYPQRSFDDFPEVYKAPETNVKNFLSMVWGRWLLNRNIVENNLWNDYEIFIYIRPDVCFDNALDLNNLEPILVNNDLLFPSNGHWRNGINDQTFFGGRKLESALTLFGEIVNYVNEGVILHPETMLLHHLIKKNIRIVKYPIQNYIFRSNIAFNIG
jgi:hypothetical protein